MVVIKPYQKISPPPFFDDFFTNFNVETTGFYIPIIINHAYEQEYTKAYIS